MTSPIPVITVTTMPSIANAVGENGRSSRAFAERNPDATAPSSQANVAAIDPARYAHAHPPGVATSADPITNAPRVDQA